MMASSKKITACYGNTTFQFLIYPTMNALTIYNIFRGCNLVASEHVKITTSAGELASLSYHDFQEHHVYNLHMSDKRVQGPCTFTGAYKRTFDDLAVITDHWNLASSADIFPPEGGFMNMGIGPRTPTIHEVVPTISGGFDTPLLIPELWPAHFTSELRRVSSRTQGNHRQGLQMISARVAARWESEGLDALSEAQASDLRGAVLDLDSLISGKRVAVACEPRTAVLFPDELVVAEDMAKGVYYGGVLDALPEVDEEQEKAEHEVGSIDLPLR